MILRCLPWLVIILVALVSPALAADDGKTATRLDSVLDNEFYKVSLDFRLRLEFADADGTDDAQAYTFRSRIGLGSKPLFGFSAFAEVENIFAFDDDSYFDLVHTPNGETGIGDPEETELNRLFLQYENEELLGLKLKAGRQRIILDDSRFVGNVGWRQNEQTFDAAQAWTTFGVEGLALTYAWVEEAHRIFGNDGPPSRKDLDSDSHLVNLSYRVGPALRATVFAYLLDIDDVSLNSADSYGFRLTGDLPVHDAWSLAYAFSWVHQQDAADNPVDYETSYLSASATLGYAPAGKVGIGFERLGSDQGRAVFVTPFATAHKFNGFADVFLNNGGPNGLRDLWFDFAPRLPWGLAGKLTYHHFWADESGGSLGDELDAVLFRKLPKGFTVFGKAAWFEGRQRGPADIWRASVELKYSY